MPAHALQEAMTPNIPAAGIQPTVAGIIGVTPCMPFWMPQASGQYH